MNDWLPIIRVILDNLLLRNGKGTVQGFLIGIILSGTVKLFHPLLQKIRVIEIDKLPIYYFLAIGIGIMHLPWFSKKPSFPPEVENALKAIKVAQENGLSNAHAKLLYRNVAEKTIQNISNGQNSPPQSPVSEAIDTISQSLKG